MNTKLRNDVRQGILHKLPYICLELLNTENPESVDYIIARYLVEHIYRLSGVSIQDIADACSVSKSTISRFCRKAGLEDFQEMKDELYNSRPYRDVMFNTPLVSENGESYLQLVAKQALALDQALDYKKISTLASEIYTANNVLLMGSMQAMNPAVNLQQDLFASDKVTRAPGMFSLQLDALTRAKAGDLVICFSNSGSFFERLFMTSGDIHKLDQLKIWMITGNENLHLPYINETILVPDTVSSQFPMPNIPAG